MKNLLPDPMVDDRAPIAYIDQGKLPHTVQTIMDMHELEQSVQSGSPWSIYEGDLFLDPSTFLDRVFAPGTIRLLVTSIRTSVARIFQLRNTQLYLASQHLPANR